MTATTASAPVTVAELVAAVRAQQGEGAAPDAREPATSFRAAGAFTVLVVAAHAGAGATAVSVALADAWGRAGTRVQLVDAAPSESSGMLGATDRELANADGSWRTGRRGPITVHRPTGTAPPTRLPSCVAAAGDVVVIDAGAPWRTLTSGSGLLWPPGEGTELLLVCRATVPGVRHAELALVGLPGQPFVVGVGAGRWPRPVKFAFGPRLAQATHDGRVGLVPPDRRLAQNGIDGAPFGGPVAAAATRLAELVGPGITGPRTRPRGGRRR